MLLDLRFQAQRVAQFRGGHRPAENRRAVIKLLGAREASDDHRLVPGLDPQRADCAADAALPDDSDLETLPGVSGPRPERQSPQHKARAGGLQNEAAISLHRVNCHHSSSPVEKSA